MYQIKRKMLYPLQLVSRPLSKAIAEAHSRHKSTIYREIKRNPYSDLAYGASHADCRYKQHQKRGFGLSQMA